VNRNLLRTIGAATLLVAACFVVYLPALDGPFVSDDVDNIVHNAHLQTASGLRATWTEIPGPQGVYYPLTFTTYWVEHRLWGSEPRGYHIVNILLHALNAILLWRVLRRLGIGGAWFAAAAFALHPVQAESVAWITERRNLLSTFFLLTTVWCYFSSERGKGWHAATIGSYIAALLSKTVTIVLPPAILLLLWWKKGRISRADLARVLPLFAVAIAAGLVTLGAERQLVARIGGAWLHRGFGERLALAGQLVWFYVGSLVWPAKLAFVYPRSAIDPARLVSWLPTIGVAAVFAALIVSRERTGRAPLAAWSWFVGTLLPVLGLASFFYLIYSDAADRFLYVPSMGLFALASGSVAATASTYGARARGALVLLGLVVVGGLGALTFQRARVFASPEALYADAIEKYPDSWGAQLSLGSILVTRGQFAEAIPHLEASRRLQPTVPGASAYLAVAYGQVGRTAEAMEMYGDALRLYPGDLFARSNLGLALWRSGQDDQAAVELRRVLDTDPTYAGAKQALLTVLLRMIVTRSRSGRAEEAVRLAREAVPLAEATGAGDLRTQLSAFIQNGGTSPPRRTEP